MFTIVFMKMKIIGTVVFLVALAASLNAEGRKSYDGYRTYKIIPRNEHEINIIKLLKNEGQLDFWTVSRQLGRQTVVMVPPELQKNFETLMAIHRIQYSVLIENVESVVIKERASNEIAPKVGPGKISFDKFYRYDDIVAYVKQLEVDYPDLVTTQVIGQTLEGRDIQALTISSGGNGERNAIFIEAGIHAREWIAPAVALYLINQLVENYDNNRDLVDDTDWLIVPVTNPDGYEYTHTDDRFWRKNRNPNGGLCYGVDANRNFGYHYGESGASSQPCAEDYKGKGAFSEKESDSIRAFAVQNHGRILLYIALHSYGPYWLWPWGYDYINATDWKDLDDLGKAAADAIYKASGNRRDQFEVGNSAGLLYPAAGGSDDWFKGGNDVKYAYTVELPGGGSEGFDPPPSDIKPIVTEIFEGLKVSHDTVAQKAKTKFLRRQGVRH